MAKTKIWVSTQAELYEAMATATGGETILLAAADYGKVYVGPHSTFDADYTSKVTIKSADADNPASFAGFNLIGGENITIDNVVFDSVFEAGDLIHVPTLEISDSKIINITNSTFDGDVASGVSQDADGYGYGTGLAVKNSSDVKIANNEFFDWHRAAVNFQSDGVSYIGNDIHSIRSDGLNFAEVRDVVIQDNHLHDFKVSPTSSDHLDMIQFWTSGSVVPTTDVLIKGNILDIGNGHWTQSIFMGNEVVAADPSNRAMFYQNIVVEDNTIYNNHWHGVTVGPTDGLIVRNNSLILSTGDGAFDFSNPSTPGIYLSAESTNVQILNNIAETVSGYAGQSDWTRTNNQAIQNRDANDPGYYGDVFVSSSLDISKGEHNYIVDPTSDVGKSGAGSSHVQLDETPSALTALYRVYSRDEAAEGTLVFDASLSKNSAGDLDPAKTTYEWSFGDGTTATGQIVQRTYSEPGHYDVKLKVTTDDGKKASETYTVGYSGDALVIYDAATASFVNKQYGEVSTLKTSTLDVDSSAYGTAISMDGAGVQASVHFEELAPLFGNDNYEISFKLKATLGTASAGEIFRVHVNNKASVDADGNLVFYMFDDAGQSTVVTSKNVSLLDGGFHDVSISFDGEQDLLKLQIDGGPQVTADVDHDAGTRPSGLWFGNPWGGTNFNGLISDFKLTSFNTDYAEFSGSAADIDDEVVVDPGSNTGVDEMILDFAELIERPNALVGDAKVIPNNDGYAVSFDGEGDSVLLGRLEEFEDSNQLTAGIEFRRDIADGADAQLFMNHKTLAARLLDDGVVVRIGGVGDEFKSFKVANIGLNDTDIHNLVVIADADADRLQVLVDDIVVLDETTFDLELVRGEDREFGWNLSGRNSGFFDGDVFDFRISETADFVGVAEDSLGL